MSIPLDEIATGPRFSPGTVYDPQLAFFDVDNTLVGNNSGLLPSDRFYAAVQAAGEGVVGVVTARQPQKAEHIIDKMGMTGFNILGNGSVIFDAATGNVIEKPLSLKGAFGVVECLQENGIHHTIQDDGVDYRWLPPAAGSRHVTQSNMGPYAYANDIWRPIGPDNGTVDFAYSMNKPFVIVAHGITEQDHRYLNVMLATGGSTLVPSQWGRMATQLGHEYVQPNGPALYDVFILHPEATKEYALEQIARQQHLGLDDIMLVGDGPNDAQAISRMGTGVAMGNAVESTLAVATHIAPTIEHDGAAIALEQLIIR